MSPADLLRCGLAAILLLSVAAKLRAGMEGPAALGSYGIRGTRARVVVWCVVVAAEAAVAVAVAADVRGAPVAGALLVGAFAVALAAALARGRAGAPCGCFGARSRVTRGGAARTALLAAAFAAVPFVPDRRLGLETWLATGLGLALVLVAALAVALLALAREVGELRLAVAPQAALSLDDEGPPLGSRPALDGRLPRSRPLTLAVFRSPGCPLCDSVEPAVRLVATDPALDVAVFDEEADAEVWRELGVPGSPYGVVLDHDGAVVAKGTFNTLRQLEGLVAAGERRAAEAAAA